MGVLFEILVIVSPYHIFSRYKGSRIGYFLRRCQESADKIRITSIVQKASDGLEINPFKEKNDLNYYFSIGFAIMLPHSVHEPS